MPTLRERVPPADGWYVPISYYCPDISSSVVWLGVPRRPLRCPPVLTPHSGHLPLTFPVKSYPQFLHCRRSRLSRLHNHTQATGIAMIAVSHHSGSETSWEERPAMDERTRPGDGLDVSTFHSTDRPDFPGGNTHPMRICTCPEDTTMPKCSDSRRIVAYHETAIRTRLDKSSRVSENLSSRFMRPEAILYPIPPSPHSWGNHWAGRPKQAA
jgi:hypothetical protein